MTGTVNKKKAIDHRKKGLISSIIPKELLEPLKDLPFSRIAKQLNSTDYIVKTSLIHHGLFRGKMYLVNCIACGEQFGYFGKPKKFCSNHCKHKQQHIWNRGLTKETIPTLNKASERMKGNKLNKLVDYQNKQRLSLRLPILQVDITYSDQSQLERQWLLQVDQSKGVKSIKQCDFTIDYIDDVGKERSYYPDYVVEWETGLRWLVEIKGICTDETYIKMTSATEWCKDNGYHYKLITTGMVKQSSWATIYSHPKNIKIPSYEWVMMSHAVTWAKLSPSQRLQVGAVATSMNFDAIFGFGYNGDERGGANISQSFDADTFIHAEENCLLKCKTSESLKLFITDNPCYRCAQRIINAKNIKEVYYLRRYRDVSGVGLLIASGIPTYHFQLTDYVGKPLSEEEAFKALTPSGLY